MAIRLKACKCGAFSQEEITQCPECGGLEFKPFTADDGQKIIKDGNIRAFFINWPDSGDWQQVAAKDDLEKNPQT